MEDLSVDISTLGRAELLTKLDLSPATSSNTEELRNKLRKSLEKSHPIHEYTNQLSHESLNKLYLIIFQKSGKFMYDKMRKSLTNEMFRKFPKNPLATLIWIFRRGRIPTEIEFGFILEMIAENSTVNDLSPEMDDLTMTESIDESMNEISQESEINPTNKGTLKGE